MNGEYACLELFTYSGLEAMTYADMQMACALVPEPPSAFVVCAPRELVRVAPVRSPAFAGVARALTFEARF